MVQCRPSSSPICYAATAGFTPDGTRRFRQTELVNQAHEANTYQGYLAAQQAWGLARLNYADRFQANNAEFGNLLQGNSTWHGGWNGGATVLPHTLPKQSYDFDPGTGKSSCQDNQGQFHQQGQNGDWYGDVSVAAKGQVLRDKCPVKERIARTMFSV